MKENGVKLEIGLVELQHKGIAKPNKVDALK